MKKRTPIPNSKWDNPQISSMRNYVHGNELDVEIHRVVSKAEAMRNDDAMLAAAEAKRQRKAEKRK